MSRPMQKLHFASSTYSASILKHCDVSVDDFVFDKDLQNKVYRRIAPIVKNENVNVMEKGKHENASLLDEAEEVPTEVLRNFYCKIKSLETLKQIIETVFLISIKNTEKQSNDANSFVKHAVYERIWNTYKHTDKELKDKKASQADGNHVRHVVKPIEDRLTRVDQRLKKEMQEMKKERQEMKTEMQEMKDKIDQMLMLLKSKN